MSLASQPVGQIQVSPPRLFTTGALVRVIGYGVALAFPALLLAFIVVCLPRYGLVTYLVPLAALGAATLFLPFGFGNRCVCKLVSSLRPISPPNREQFIVQLSLRPRLRSGLRAMVEDADDIGWLSLTEKDLMFEGDSIRLSIPFTAIRRLRAGSSGWRGLFVCGPRIGMAVDGLGNVQGLEFAERSSWWVPGSRQTARRIHRSIAERVTDSPRPVLAPGGQSVS